MPRRYASWEIERVLKHHGFVWVSTKGSHQKFVRDGLIVIVPARRKEVPAGTLSSILRQSGLRLSDFED